jgi:hypothetical protein
MKFFLKLVLTPSLIVVLTIVTFINNSTNSFGQTTVWFQGFEGASVCTENWGYTGGNSNTNEKRTGNNSSRVGRSGETNLLTFNEISVADLVGAQLSFYHRVVPGSGVGMDTREGVICQVKLDGGSWSTIGRISGNSDHGYAWTATGGTSNTCSPADNYQMPNPMSYNIPAGTNTIQMRFITINYGGTTSSCNAACRCDLFKAAMSEINPTPMNFDRTDEGFYIDDVRITTTSTILPGIWTGIVSTDWHNCENWHNRKVPDANTNVIIPSTASNNCHVRNNNGAARSVTINSADGNTPDLIVRDSRTLAVGSSVVINKTGGSGNSDIEIYNGGHLNVTGDVTLNRTAGTGRARLIMTNSGTAGTLTCNNYTLNGTNQNGEEAELKHDQNNLSNVYINGNLTINAGGTVDMSAGGDVNYLGKIHIRGNWIAASSESDFKQTGSIVVFDGTGDQRVITGTTGYTGNCHQLPCEVFYNFVVNKTSGNVYLDNHLDIEGKVTYTSGDVISTQSSLLVYKTGSSYETVSNTSHSNGPVRKIGNTAFTFPIGNGTYYRQASISAPGNTGDHFTGQYFFVNPNTPGYTTSIKETSLNNVSICEYWILDRTGGSSNVNVTLSWNSSTSCGVADLADLRVARWGNLSTDASMMWRDHGNGGTTGNTTAGTIITSAAVTRFSPFTLASHIGLNPLPVNLLNFNTVCEKNKVSLLWKTASEKNNDYFTVERSGDDLNFTEIGRINGAGSSSVENSYQIDDINPIRGNAYYRLKQTDYDGKFEYFDIIFSNCNTHLNDVTIYPNPSNGEIIVNGISENSHIIITDFTGKLVFEIKTNKTLNYFDLSNLSSGVYHIRINSENKTMTQKIVIEK